MLLTKIINRFSSKNFRNLIKQRKKIEQKTKIESSKTLSKQLNEYRQPSIKAKKFVSYFSKAQFVPSFYCAYKSYMFQGSSHQYYEYLNLINYWSLAINLISNSYRLYYGYRNKDRTRQYRKIFVLTATSLVAANVMVDSYFIKSLCTLSVNMVNVMIERKFYMQENAQFESEESNKIKSQQVVQEQGQKQQFQMNKDILNIRAFLNIVIIIQMFLYFNKKRKQNQINKLISEYQQENLKEKLKNQARQNQDKKKLVNINSNLNDNQNEKPLK